MENLSVTECVAANVRRERQRLGWGLAELSERVTAAGHSLSLKTLSKIETNGRGISVDDLRALASALGVAVDELLADPSLRDIEELEALMAEWRAAAALWAKLTRDARTAGAEVDHAIARLRDFVGDHPDIGPALEQALADEMNRPIVDRVPEYVLRYDDAGVVAGVELKAEIEFPKVTPTTNQDGAKR